MSKKDEGATWVVEWYSTLAGRWVILNTAMFVAFSKRQGKIALENARRVHPQEELRLAKYRREDA